MFFSLLARAFCCPGRDGRDLFRFVPLTSHLLTKVLSVSCVASWWAPLLILWPHLPPLPLTCSILATLTPLPFFQHGKHVPKSGLLNLFYSWLKQFLLYGFWSLLKCYLLRIVSPGCSIYSILYLMPLIIFSFFQPCFILFVMYLSLCVMLYVYLNVYMRVCVCLFPLPPLFVFPFVESNDLEPVMLDT